MQHTVPPVVLASIETFNGADTCILRLKSLVATQAVLMLQEETSYDSETLHIGEKAAVIVLNLG